MCIPEIDLKSNTEKLLLDKAKEKLCKKKEHLLQSCEKVYPVALLAWWGEAGRKSNGFKSNKINWINKDDKCQTTKVNGTWEILPSLYKNLIDLGILVEHIRSANKFLIWLIYVIVSQM